MSNESVPDFGIIARETLSALLSAIEAADEDGRIECDVGDGVLEAKYGETTYLINWHPPSSQIWVASPISGSVRFLYDTDSNLWYSERGAQELFSFVKQDMCAAFDLPK
ncbi:frataxin family protein [Anaplasma capra]|uniref:frataxin family protein n=1 Tax=Anaplasma capra TaxID=1562740 RepID=UPI0021D5DF4F|nr:frataxin family protein [Anaplasma capra]MCU7611715.1 frataxin family protein [Anaplasma capra]MCU7612534.1 frataxin family protein [Anaplasma capra]